EKSCLLSDLKKYALALAAIDKAIESNDDDGSLYLSRSLILFNLQRYPEALATIDKAIQINPFYVNYYNRGYIYQEQGNDRAALADYNQALAKDEEFIPAIINIGYIKYENGDVDGAIGQWEKAVQISSRVASVAEPQMALAVALYAKGEQQKALNMAQAALHLDKSFADVEVLKQNLWGTHLIDEARKLLSHPSIQALQTKQ
ncbi:MAG: tetratricopeptide repeat protein, partial [Nostoc sp.]